MYKLKKLYLYQKGAVALTIATAPFFSPKPALGVWEKNNLKKEPYTRKIV